jgi:hypothetical protein
MSRGMTGEEKVTFAMIGDSFFNDCGLSKLQKLCR